MSTTTKSGGSSVPARAVRLHGAPDLVPARGGARASGGVLASRTGDGAVVVAGQELDRYTAAHAGAGMLFGAVDVPWWMMLLGAVAWAYMEDSPAKRMMVIPTPNVPDRAAANHGMGDVVATMIGWAITRVLPEHKR